MGVIKLHKVISNLPSTLDPDALYVVRTGQGFTLYVTDATGSIAHTQNAVSDVQQQVITTPFSQTGTTPQDIPSLAFTPAANSIYEIKAVIVARTNDATSGVQIGWAYPTSGVTDTCIRANAPTSGTQTRIDQTTGTAIGRSFATAWPGANQSFLMTVEGVIVTTSPVSGTFKLTVQSELTTATSIIQPGSFLSWRALV